MAETKTKPTGESVDAYLAARATAGQLADCKAVMAMCERVTGERPTMEQAPPPARAFEVMGFDGHKIDLRVTLRYTDPVGFEHLPELTRRWILVALDVTDRAVIEYKLALSKEYNKDDVAGAFQAALTPFRPRIYKIPNLGIRKEGGYPSAVYPKTGHACWEW